MKKYIGIKIVEVKPMNRKEYNDFRGWELPGDENGGDPGFLKDDGCGHIQWDPEETFKRDFKPCDTMTFGMAIEAMKAGHKVARAGWNGKGMFIYHVPGGNYKAQTDAAKSTLGDVVPYGPYIAMKTAQGNVVPWLASQTDVLAEDWEIVE